VLTSSYVTRTNRVSDFVSNVVYHLNQELSSKHDASAAHLPKSRDKVERANRSLSDISDGLSQRLASEWEICLTRVAFSLSCVAKESVGGRITCERVTGPTVQLPSHCVTGIWPVTGCAAITAGTCEKERPMNDFQEQKYISRCLLSECYPGLPPVASRILDRANVIDATEPERKLSFKNPIEVIRPLSIQGADGRVLLHWQGSGLRSLYRNTLSTQVTDGEYYFIGRILVQKSSLISLYRWIQ
jgi:hypothetical protein